MFFIFRPYSEQKSYIRIHIFVISSVPKLKNNTDENVFFIFRPYGEKKSYIRIHISSDSSVLKPNQFGRSTLPDHICLFDYKDHTGMSRSSILKMGSLLREFRVSAVALRPSIFAKSLFSA